MDLCDSLVRVPLDIVVYRRIGGDSLEIANCRTVGQMIKQVDEVTDWLWGSGNAYRVFDVQNMCTARSSTRFFEGTHRYQIIYTERVTSIGFPCSHCWCFVSWHDPIWYTRYVNIFWERPLTHRNRLALYSPRDYFCWLCGPELVGRHRRHLERVNYDHHTQLFSYTSLCPFE